MSIECEDKNLRNINASFAEEVLKSAYLVSAQILTAQGKFDLARARLTKARALPGNILILLEDLENTVDGYLMERTGRIGDAEQFYRRSSRPYALVRLGAIYLDQGRIADATQAISDSVKGNPSDPAAQAILGEILERSDKSSALTAYKLALTLAQQGNPSVVPLTYIEVGRAKRGVARLQ
jgi:tetratricopeptide (TPR) repeat protein